MSRCPRVRCGLSHQGCVESIKQRGMSAQARDGDGERFAGKRGCRSFTVTLPANWRVLISS